MNLGFLTSSQGWPYLLVPFIPIAVVLELVHASPTAVFATSALGVIPTAALTPYLCTVPGTLPAAPRLSQGALVVAATQTTFRIR